jgi:hypothetical protein
VGAESRQAACRAARPRLRVHLREPLRDRRHVGEQSGELGIRHGTAHSRHSMRDGRFAVLVLELARAALREEQPWPSEA